MIIPSRLLHVLRVSFLEKEHENIREHCSFLYLELQRQLKSISEYIGKIEEIKKDYKKIKVKMK